VKKKAKFFDLVATSRLAIPMILASVIGMSTGLLVVAFIKAIRLSETFFFKALPENLPLGSYSMIFIPALGALIVGILCTTLAPDAKGHGVPEVLKAIALPHGKITLRVVLVKLFASAISIGSGSSVGREGPSVQIGAGVGSTVGRFFKLSETRVRNLVACGSAAGIAAVFNAPITGVMFALEIILRDFGTRALSTVVVASVASSIVSQIFLGSFPAFSIPSFHLQSPFEILTYLALGILSAFAAVLFVLIFDKTETFFDRWKCPVWLKPAAGGLLVGAIGYLFPEILGMGFNIIERTFEASLDIKLLAGLILIKMLTTSLSVGSGSSGGTFGPTLFVGAALGGVFGKLIFNQLPFPVGLPGAYALVGMASVFSGAFHAPVTAIFLVFELTADYHMILPIMVASVVATSISQLITNESMDTIKLKKSGINIEHLEEVKAMSFLQVKDAMSEDFELAPGNMPAKELIDKVSQKKDCIFFVVNARKMLLGAVRPEDIQSVLIEEDIRLILAADIATPLEEYCVSDEPISEATKLMLRDNLAYLPVMDPSDHGKIVGVLKSQDIFRVYTDLTAKRTSLFHRMEEHALDASGTISIHFAVTGRSPVTGKILKELALPHGVVLTSIKRGNKVIVPQGDSALKAKDRVWAVLHSEAEPGFKDWLKQNQLTALQ